MAKTIKFNLILDGHAVRTLDDMREHFSIEDVLKYYENGLLLRWLDVRGYKEQYDIVNNIDSSQDLMDIIKQLIKIFKVETDEKEIEEAIYILKYLREDMELKKAYSESSHKTEQILDDYFSGYRALILHMCDNKDNIAVLKADAKEMLKYKSLFSADFYRLYFYLYENAPKAIFAILTIEKLREYWLGDMQICKDSVGFDEIAKEPEKVIYYHIKDNFLGAANINTLKETLGDDLKIVTRDTNGMWDTLETDEVKVMIIETASQINVKNIGQAKEKLECKDVKYKFPILNGLEFQCSNASQSLMYMEV